MTLAPSPLTAADFPECMFSESLLGDPIYGNAVGAIQADDECVCLSDECVCFSVLASFTCRIRRPPTHGRRSTSAWIIATRSGVVDRCPSGFGPEPLGCLLAAPPLTGWAGLPALTRHRHAWDRPCTRPALAPLQGHVPLQCRALLHDLDHIEIVRHSLIPRHSSSPQ